MINTSISRVRIAPLVDMILAGPERAEARLAAAILVEALEEIRTAAVSR